MIYLINGYGSDSVTNSYGESWDSRSSSEQIMSPTTEPSSPISKKQQLSPKLKMLGPLCDQIDKIYSFVNQNEN